MLEILREMDGRQKGDPVVAAERIWEVVTGDGMARGVAVGLRLPLGSDCLKTVREKMDRVRGDFERYEDIAKSTDAK